MRGGEKVLEAACQLFPEAKIFTLIHRPGRVSALINSRQVQASWLNRLPGVHRYYRYLLPLMPFAIKSFDLSDYDLVLSFNHCVAKGVSLAPGGGRKPPLHICYCHTPMRYIYGQFQDYFADNSRHWLKAGASLLRPFLMRWDRDSSRGVDYFVANSANVRDRVRRAYERDAEVIYPAVGTDFFTPSPNARPAGRSYYLIAGALVPYKRVDLAIEACRKLGVHLKIVGVGTERERLQELARGADVEFLGWQDDESLRELYRGCEAFLFPPDEDFGIAPVEAMACGRPVVAYKKGGALETVREGVTGVFFDEQTPEAMAAAIERAKAVRFDSGEIRRHAMKFDDKHFKARFSEFIRGAQEREGRMRVMEVVECGGLGGTGFQVAAICNGLDKSRFETELVYAVRSGCSPSEYEEMCAGAERFFYIHQMVREVSPWSDLLAFVRLYRLFKARRPDVVHAHSSKAGFLTRLAGWAAGVPAIYYSPRGYSFLQTDRSALVRGFYRLLERIATPFGSVVAVSDSEAELARGLGARDVRVIRDAYLGSLTAGDALPPERKDVVICATGRLTFARNPESFLRLAQRLTDARNGIKCVWIGGGELQLKLEEMIRDLGLSRRFEITGWLPHEAALKRLAGTNILVHYSRWDSMPNAVLEAMVLGIPVVASDIPGNRGLVRENENGFLATNEPELLEKTLRLIDDAALRKRLGARGKEMSSAFTRERLLKEIATLYAVPA